MSKHQISNDRALIVSTLTKLSPGVMVDIQLSAGDKLRLKAKLVGYEEGGYFAFSLPKQVYHQYQDRLFEGKSCVVRMIIEGESGLCVAFKSQIITLNKKPQIMLFTQYPEQIEFIRLRKKNRINTHLPVLLTEQQAPSDTASIDPSDRLEGVVLDLSEDGCRVELAAPQGQHKSSLVFVQLLLRFPLNPDKPILLNGQVKSQQRCANNKVRVGIQFESNKYLETVFNKLNLFSHPSFA
ncbi:flagellar brake domain-containing protein [Agarivorans sp. MS3-6]|uniref:flagellar brake domain-containing protein n=1 Tax=Agarivorans sp. TSD2052 TaxID=2937286 RepID=UPI00200DB96F|nr:PilZ domain-containing protein [Agarivorans sp. TSD2052]UPW19961.1 flagellar brake protein [Agarivorans sp. TSD2052]